MAQIRVDEEFQSSILILGESDTIGLKAFVLCQVIRDLELLPLLLGQDWSSVFLQRFDGAVTYVTPLPRIYVVC
jgi:hypothetical protein